MAKQTENTSKVACVICGHEAAYIGPHVQKEHGLKPSEYAKLHNAPLWPADRAEEFKAAGSSSKADNTANQVAGRVLRAFHAGMEDVRQKMVALADEVLAPMEEEAANAKRNKQQQRDQAAADRKAKKEKREQDAADRKAKREAEAEAKKAKKDEMPTPTSVSKVEKNTSGVNGFGQKVDETGTPIRETPAVKQAKRTADKKELMGMKRDELLAKAKAMSIDLPANSAKAVIVEAILRSKKG